MNTMLNKTLLASALLIALTGTVQAANPNEGSRTSDAARSATSSPGTGSPSNPIRTNNDGSPGTNQGALSGNNANVPASERSVGSDSNPSRFNNDGSRSTGHGALATGANARAGANADYSKSARYSEYRSTSSAYSARGSDFIGAYVMSSDNGSIGAIDDVIVSRSDNKLHAVIDVGRGVGDRLVSVPLDDLRIDSNGTVYLNTTEAQLRQRDSFGYNDGESRGIERTMSRRAILETPARQ
jgi:hypothetical protein